MVTLILICLREKNVTKTLDNLNTTVKTILSLSLSLSLLMISSAVRKNSPIYDINPYN